MKTRSVYMDNNATTAMAPEVIKALHEAENIYGNASSMHSFGRQAAALIKSSRISVAQLLGCNESEVLFNSGATESNNAVFNIARRLIESGKGKKIVTTSIEHPAIIETVKYLRSEGIAVDVCPVDSEGRVKISELEKLVTDDTVLVSVMMGNNESGAIQDIDSACRIAHRHHALFHTDATQAVGKMTIDFNRGGFDYMSLSAHKFYGPKGVGALIVRTGAPLDALLHGGHQENGIRPGTYNTQAIYGMGVAASLAAADLDDEIRRLWEMREALRKGILERIDDVVVNGSQEHCLPGTLDVSFPRAEGESILLMLDMKGVAVSTGSACATGSLEPSYVLMATGMNVELAHGSIRFSLGRYNSMDDVKYVLDVLPPIIKTLREMSTR
ncbi:MAG: cysteine desulfurase family protein [Sphaerochaetaceae bacterium]|nr:cysteine desulfurase family protein [Sphaerochaetaceae bacterium]MDD3164068.1 cysteine desulfurase family protein [Sphaerochaetaceae bacterium]MDD4006854.1 cysteine desulfurase family protein [Sphaerochaetaceae bacterium]MDD4395984.1 cysteine desulfurase family protein [Sphaerochaetaceae bacterium]